MQQTLDAGIVAKVRARVHPSSARTPARTGQRLLGAVWLIDGLLKFQPYFFHHLVNGVIDPSAAGQPDVIGQPILWVGRLVEPHQALFTVLAGLVEGSIGVALLSGRAVKPALLLSFAWAGNIWVTGEGVGGLFTGTAPNPLLGVLATAPLYVVAGLLVWPRNAGSPQTGRASARASAFGLLGVGGARLVWAALWLAAAALWLVPSNAGAGALHDVIAGAPSGAGWLSSLQSNAAGAVAGDGMTFALLLALISAEIALSVLTGRGTRVALAGAIGLSVLSWTLAEGFGGLFTGQATDVGTGPLMILIAVLLLPLSAVTADRPLAAVANGSPPSLLERWRPQPTSGSPAK